MKSHDAKLTETDVVDKILRMMTPHSNYVTCVIEEANDVETLSIDGLLSSILVQEQRMKGQKEEDQVSRPGRSGGRERGRDIGRGRGR